MITLENVKQEDTIIIFGCSEVGSAVLSFLCGIGRNDSILFCDNSSKKQGYFKDREVLPVDKAVSCYGNSAYYVLASIYHFKQMMEQLSNLGISEDRIISALPDEIVNAQVESEQRKRLSVQRRFRFEVNINKHCNLNCRGCDHFAPIADADYLELNIFESDMRRMSELFMNMTYQIQLLGGEPLLNPNLVFYIEIARRYFQESQICIATNGILLPKMNASFWESCKINDITISLTRYPVNIDYGSIGNMVQSKGIQCEYVGSSEGGRTLWHFPLDLMGNQDIKESFINCRNANQCFTLERGRLYTCSIAPNILMFNKYFDKHLDLTEEDGVDIYSARSSDEILKIMATPMPFCRYCDVKNRSYDHKWEVSKKRLEEWT